MVSLTMDRQRAIPITNVGVPHLGGHLANRRTEGIVVGHCHLQVEDTALVGSVRRSVDVALQLEDVIFTLWLNVVHCLSGLVRLELGQVLLDALRSRVHGH